MHVLLQDRKICQDESVSRRKFLKVKMTNAYLFCDKENGIRADVIRRLTI